MTQEAFKGAGTNTGGGPTSLVLHLSQNFVLISRFCLKFRIQISPQVTFLPETAVAKFQELTASVGTARRIVIRPVSAAHTSALYAEKGEDREFEDDFVDGQGIPPTWARSTKSRAL